MLNATSPAIERFLTAWYENGRASRARTRPGTNYDLYTPKPYAVDRKRWICLDQDDSGRFLVDRATGDVYTIKAYGRPHSRIGSLAGLTAEFEAGTATYAAVA